MDMGLQNYTLEIFYAAWNKAITTVSAAAFILQVWGPKLANYSRVTQEPTNTILLSGKRTKSLTSMIFNNDPVIYSPFWFVPLSVTVKHMLLPL